MILILCSVWSLGTVCTLLANVFILFQISSSLNKLGGLCLCLIFNKVPNYGCEREKMGGRALIVSSGRGPGLLLVLLAKEGLTWNGWRGLGGAGE